MKRNFFHNQRIFIQLALFTIIVSVIPIIIVISLFSFSLQQAIERELYESYKQVMIQYSATLQNEVDQKIEELDQFANNTILIDELLHADATDNAYITGSSIGLEVHKFLSTYTKDEIVNITVYTDIEDVDTYASKVSTLEVGRKELWYENYLQKQEEVFVYESRSLDYPILSIVKEIKYVDTENFQLQYLGLVKLDLNLDYFFQVQDNNVYSINVHNEGELVYRSGDEEFINITSIEEFEEHNEMLLYKINLEGTNLDIMFGFDQAQEHARIRELIFTLFPIISIVIVFIIVCSYIYTRSITRRIEALIVKVKSIEEGDFTEKDSVGGNDEITELDHQFNRMNRQLYTLIQHNYIQQLEKKEAQLKQLQYQVNPHFLDNTLETISSLAAVQGAFLICDICQKLGEIFRYSLGKNFGDYVSIKKELEYTKNYIFIQETRFQGRFSVHLEIEKEVEDMLILRFVLQPIVENAILHGLSRVKEGGKLWIQIQRVVGQSSLKISVRDNGIGMTAERLAEIRAYLEDEIQSIKSRKKSNIGIKNVQQRIKLSHGIEYGMTVTSDEGIGTEFLILIPIMT